MEKIFNGCTCVEASDLKKRCDEILSRIDLEIKDKLERNRKRLKEEFESWENVGFFWKCIRPLVDIFAINPGKISRKEFPKHWDDDTWVKENTPDPDDKSYWPLFLYAYKLEERQALNRMRALCRIADGKVWVSDKFAIILQNEERK